MPARFDSNAPRSVNYLRAWREHLGLTQAEAAKLMGLSRPYLVDIESGKSPWNQAIMEAAAAAYGVPVPLLLAVDPKSHADVWELFMEVMEGDQITAAAVRQMLQLIRSTSRSDKPESP